jgi:hypothetical protein
MRGGDGIGRWRTALPAALALACALPAGAVVVDQVDDFEDGTEQGWAGGSARVNQPTGGPAGADDNFLDIDSGGFLLGAFNLTQWSGDYGAAGVASVRLDANNAGPDEVSLRLTVFTAGCGPGMLNCTAWTSNDAAVLPAGSGWQTVEFPLAEADMTQVVGSDTLADTLANVQRILLRHDPTAPSPPGTLETVDAVLGIDNVTALPEPATAPALAAGGWLVLRLARRRRRSARS